MNLTLHGRTLDQLAIETLRTFEPPEGYWLADSGGKDSSVLLDLAQRSGVRFEANYSVTPVDPPEIHRFLRTQHPGTAWIHPRYSAIQLAAHNAMLPTMRIRWCCREWKERGGTGRTVLTGIRAAESPRRRRRSQVETCIRKPGTHYVHPILDWTNADVWQYITERSIPTCSLYAEGYKRIGCVLCPMTRDTLRQTSRWPRIALLWRRMAQAAWQARHDANPAAENFPTPAAYFTWWLDRDAPAPRQETPLFPYQETPLSAACPEATP